jgi:hypothetical protein
MALTVSIVEKFVVGARQGIVADITFDSSYPAGGLALTPAQLKFRNSISFIDSGAARNATTGIVDTRFDTTTGKFQAFSGVTETTAATDLSAYKVRIYALGK